jgi:hypothetical protein
MSIAPFWAKPYGDPDDGRWDSVWVGGQLLPGVSRIKGLKSKREVESNKSPNTNGASTKDKGAEPQEFEIVTKIWTPEQWEQWQLVRPVIDPMRPNAISQPLAIVNPIPNYVGINEIIVTEIEDDPPERRAAPYIITTHCRRYYPKPVEVKTSTVVKTTAKYNPARSPEIIPDPPNMVETTFGKPPGT